MKLKNVLVVYTPANTKEDESTLSEIKTVLSKLKIKSSFVNRKNLRQSHLKKRDLIIAVGGDGTFLKTALFIKNSMPILGVNADPKMREGFFMSSRRQDFQKKIGKILKDKFKIKKLARLEATLNGKKISELALNEFYIGSDREYITSRYYIQIGVRKERHKSSGILIATPAGSYAWIKSCGGKKLKVTARKFEYVVREPYKGTINGKYKLKKGILNKGRSILLTSDMSKGFFVADSLGKEYFFKKNDKIRIQMSNKDLNVIFF